MAYVMKHAAEHILCGAAGVRMEVRGVMSTYVVRRPVGDDKFRLSIRRKMSNVLVLMVYIIITLMTDSVLRIIHISSDLRYNKDTLDRNWVAILFDSCPAT